MRTLASCFNDDTVLLRTKRPAHRPNTQFLNTVISSTLTTNARLRMKEQQSQFHQSDGTATTTLDSRPSRKDKSNSSPSEAGEREGSCAQNTSVTSHNEHSIPETTQSDGGNV